MRGYCLRNDDDDDGFMSFVAEFIYMLLKTGWMNALCLAVWSRDQRNVPQ